MVLQVLRDRVRSAFGHFTVRMDLEGLSKALEGTGSGDTDASILAEMNRLTDLTARGALEKLVRHAGTFAKQRRKFTAGFEGRLRERWGFALDLLDLATTLSLEFGSDWNQKDRGRAATNTDYTFECLARLHGRGCLTASEVSALLRSGHATGANARWRTLHELAVVAMFISQQGTEVARRYLEHDVIQRYRAAAQYEQYSEALGEEQVDVEQVEQLRRAGDELLAKYGRGFGLDYGWAEAALGGKKVSFGAIARSIDLGHWAPYVRMASDGIHAGARGAYFDLGIPDGVEAIPAGPSHFGLADPGANSLVALMQVTVPLLVHGLTTEEGDPEMDAEELVSKLLVMVQTKVIQGIVDLGCDVFMEAHGMQEADFVSIGEPPRVWSKPRIR